MIRHNFNQRVNPAPKARARCNRKQQRRAAMKAAKQTRRMQRNRKGRR